MRKAWLIAWREISWEVFGDRSALLRQGFFFLLPLLFVLSNRGAQPGSRLNGIILTLAVQCVLLPAISGVALIASTFVAERENGTLVPLLAAPIHDLDIVVGKLVGMLIPVTLISIASLAVFYGLGWLTFGITSMTAALSVEILFSLIVLAFFYLFSTGSWVLVVASRVRTSRAAQQISGILIAITILAYGGLGTVAVQLWNGYGLVLFAIGILATDLIALELARRGWQRGEVVARL